MSALTGTQVRMARAALRLHQQQLADRIGLSWATIQRIEAADGLPNCSAKTLEAVRGFFEAQGFKFRAPDNKAGPAVAAPRIDHA